MQRGVHAAGGLLGLGFSIACVGLPPTPPEQTEGSSGGDSTSTGSGAEVTGDSGIATTTMSTSASTDGGSTNGDDGTTEGWVTSSSSGSDTGPAPQQEILERADFTGCEEPLWCFVNPDVNNPAGGATYAQECFVAAIDPPFELTEVEVVIRGLADQVMDVQLEVYDASMVGPTELISSIPVDVGMLALGLNTIPVVPPVQIEQSTVCFGLAAPGGGLAGALGVSVDPGSQEPDVSYIRLMGDGGCSIPVFTEVFGLAPTPSGNWCIRGTVQSL